MLPDLCLVQLVKCFILARNPWTTSRWLWTGRSGFRNGNRKVTVIALVKTLLELADKLPPFLVFSLARTGKRGPGSNRETASLTGKRPTLEHMILVSGLSARTFTRTARKLSWAGVRVSVVDAFCKGCGVSLFKTRSHTRFLRNTFTCAKKMPHLSSRQLRNLNLLAQRHQIQKWNGQ